MTNRYLIKSEKKERKEEGKMLTYTDHEEIKSLRDVGKMFLVGVIFQFIIPAIVFFSILQIPGVIYK